MRYKIIAILLIVASLLFIWFMLLKSNDLPKSQQNPEPVTAPPAVPHEISDRTKRVSRSDVRKPVFSCKNDLARTLYKAGFRGENLHEAWAIAMRESRGQEDATSGVDYGLFQFNYPTWGNVLDYSRILDGDYNAAQAYRISKGGSTWAHWGLTGSGETDPSLYGMWSDSQVWAWITEPYQRYYNKYPC